MPRPSRGSASYRAVLALPHARPLFAAAMLARLSYGLLGLPFLLSVRAGTGSYAVAGTVSGLFGLVCAGLGPARARLVTHRPGTLAPMGGCYALLLALTALAGVTGVPAWLALALGAAAGTLTPPVGPLTRTRWGLLAADEAQRQSALSLDTVCESAAFAVGPAVGGVLISATTAPIALVVCAGLAGTGFVALATVLRRAADPGPVADPDPDPDATPDTDTDAPPSAAPGRRSRAARPSPRTPGFATALLTVSASACALAVEEIAAVATWGPGTTGWLMALCSVGGVVGGLVYGRRTWRLPPGGRLTLLAAAGAAGYALPLLLPRPSVAGVALLCVGAFGDTLLITSYLLVDERFPERARAEAGAWVNTGYNLGSALGSGCAGVLLEATGARTVLAAAALAAGAGALGAVTSGRSAVRSSPSLPGGAVAADPGAGSWIGAWVGAWFRR
jgi:predicted MFS family arabinose efflux permease